MTRIKRTIAVLAMMAWLAPWPASAGTRPVTPQEQAEIDRYRAILKSLHPVTGEVPIPGADATLHLGKDYYFLSGPEAKRVLTEGWNNPPDMVENVLGMVFPAGKTFVDEGWGAVITYAQSGYITDDDAKTADYDGIIADAQSGEDERNKARQQQGFPVQHLVGWAQPPTYDRPTHSLIWAREIRIGNETDDTLNYDVRMLGRRGVLSVNLVSTMSKLPEIRPAAATFGRAVSFDDGARYVDHDAATDKEAGYGLAGLVAAGVGVAAAKKVGIVAILAVLGKKMFLLIAALFAGIAQLFKRMFRKDELE